MDWRDEGFVISVRRHGEGAAIVEAFTAEHGRHLGVVRGGGSRRMAPLLQVGTQMSFEWRARLESHLGHFTVDPIRARAGDIMSDRAALAGLSAVAALLSLVMPEREAHPAIYARSLALLDQLARDANWPADYVAWELALLSEAGFGLDLSACAASGATEGLVYVSPKTGRAVSAEGAGEWADRLLPLPGFLRDPEALVSRDDLLAGLRLTGHFLGTHLFPALGRETLPPARTRLVRALERL